MLIGVDVGGTNLRLGVVDGLHVVWEQRYNADFSALCRKLPADQALQAILDQLAATLAEVLAIYPAARAVGIGFPGFVDPLTQVIASSPNLPGLIEVDLAQPLATRLGCPVKVENDGLAAAYGEYALCPGQPAGLIYLGLGTGIGGGLVINGRPYAGEHGVAMEIGHLIVEPGGRLCGCGNRGCMEQYASASGVALSYEAMAGRRLSAADIAQQAEHGDRSARLAYERAGEWLAQGLAHILKVVDVGCVVIGGGMSQAWPLMERAFMKRLDADMIPVLRGRLEIHISHAGDQAGMIGAALLAG
ncbi:MAG: ROK family protein [Nitrosomonadales bacterium]|nr:MAG: ROK family protein [Nitrosomonadales bacterium]